MSERSAARSRSGGRQQLNDIQPMKEIRAKSALANQRLQGAVAGASNAHVDTDFPVRSHGAHGAALNYVEQFGLKVERKVVDVIKQNRAVLGCLKKAFAVRHRA